MQAFLSLLITLYEPKTSCMKLGYPRGSVPEDSIALLQLTGTLRYSSRLIGGPFSFPEFEITVAVLL